MARPLRIEYPGAVYHVTARGNAREAIFADDTDRRRFLTTLSSVVHRYHVICHAYCLMDNHYHLILETPDGNLGPGMRQLNGVYSQQYNRRHGRVGHLFQARYKAILAEKESYLLELCRYVVLNPVRAGRVSEPAQWAWSSYGATVGEGEVADFLTVDWILGVYGGRDRTTARKRYQAFVLEGLKEGERLSEGLKGKPILGAKGFVERFCERLKEAAPLEEIPKAQRFAARPGLEVLFAEVNDKNQRNEKIYRACVDHRYTMKEIASHLGIHYTTVSKVIKGMED